MWRLYLNGELNDRKKSTKTGGKISMENKYQAQKPCNGDVLEEQKESNMV